MRIKAVSETFVIAGQRYIRWKFLQCYRDPDPRHAGLELWMAAHGHQIVSRTASQFDWCQDKHG